METHKNDNNDAAITQTYDTDRIKLPLPPENTEENKYEMESYALFMRHLRRVPNSRMEIKILASIQFTADMLDTGDALVAKTLVDLGLRAPRKAFPLSFLSFVDKSMARRGWDHDHRPVPSVSALKQHWDDIGENRFVPALATQHAINPIHPYVLS